MEWMKFHYICRQASLKLEHEQKSLTDIIDEIEQSPMASLYALEKGNKRAVSSKLLERIRNLKNSSRTKRTLSLYGLLELSELTKNIKIIKSIVNYPVTLALIFFALATLFNKNVLPEWRQFIDFDSISNIQYLFVQNNNLEIASIGLVTFASIVLFYSFIATALLKLMMSPDSFLLKAMFGKRLRLAYTNLYTLIFLPLEMAEGLTKKSPSYNIIITDYLNKVLEITDTSEREYRELCYQNQLILIEYINSFISTLRIVLFALVIMSVLGLLVGAYSSILIFGEAVL